MKKNEVVTKLKKGAFINTDPCYIFGESHEKWLSILNATNYFDGYCVVEGYAMFGAGTQHGDGQYLDEENRTYSVDAGLLSAIPMGLARKFGYNKNRIESELVKRGHANIVRFDTDFECSRDENGTIKFGHITIKTGSDDEE